VPRPRCHWNIAPSTWSLDSTCTYRSIVSQAAFGSCTAKCSEACIHTCTLCDGYKITFEVSSAECDNLTELYTYTSSRCFFSGDMPVNPTASGGETLPTSLLSLALSLVSRISYLLSFPISYYFNQAHAR
jgi:hypothetical protein